MTDFRANERAPLDEDRLPWLEAAEEDDDGGEGPSTVKLIAFVVIGLAVIGLVVGGLFWLSNQQRGSAEPELIAAPEGDYKVKPDDPGGMEVDGKGATTYAASEGAEPKAAIDMNAVPEEPLLKAPPPSNAPAAMPAPAQKASAAVPAGGGATIQLGAFGSEAGANRAWKALSSRFVYLAPLTHSVVPVETGGRTLYRLRASGPNAAELCGRLRVAGETCVTVN